MSFDDEYAKAQALAKEEKWEDAVIHYGRALKIDPAHKDAHCQMGLALHRLGRYDDALSCYDRALEIDPQYVEALDRKDSIRRVQSGGREDGSDTRHPSGRAGTVQTDKMPESQAETEPAGDRNRPGQKPDLCKACGNDLEGRILFCAACHKPAKPQVGMERGGPYSPALYEATAPLRRAQKMEVVRMKELQVRDATWRLRDTLNVVQASLEEDERSRQSAADDWKGREDRAAEEAEAARRTLRAAGKRLPAAENSLRDAKKGLSQSEDGLATAKSDLDGCQNRMSAAQSTLREAESAMEAAERRTSSAQSELDSADAAVRPARREADSAESEESSADRALNDAKAELTSAESSLRAAESRLRSAESMRDSARSALNSAERELSSARARSDGEGERHAQRRMEDARSEMRSAENEVSSAQSDTRRPQGEVGAAKKSVKSARRDADRAREASSKAMENLRSAQERAGAAQNTLSAAQSALTAAQNRVAAARAELADAKNEERTARDEKKMAERDLATAQREMSAAQRDMPSAEVLRSAQRDLEEVEAEFEAASKRAEMAKEWAATAQRKEQATRQLRDAEERYRDAEKARWDAEQDAILSLEQAVEDGELRAAEPLRAAKDLREAEENLRAARVRRADGALQEAEDTVRLARKWLTEDRDALMAAKRRLKAPRRWLSDARKEPWTDQGERWTEAQQKAFADEQGAAVALRDLADGWAADRAQRAADAERDTKRWTAFAEKRDEEEGREDGRRRRDADNVRDIDRRFGIILESLERIPEPGRTEANIDLYRSGAESAKSYHTISEAGIRLPASLEYLRSMTPDRHRSLAAMATSGGDDAYQRIRDRLSGEGAPDAVFREIFGDPQGGRYTIRPWEGKGGIGEILKSLGGIRYDQKLDIEFAREHPEAAQLISAGQMSNGALDALDRAIEGIRGSLDEISRDGKVEVTPTMDRRTLFEEGMLVLTDQGLVLYDESGQEGRERIPLDSNGSCDTGWLGFLKRSSLNVKYGDNQRSFHLPKGFSAAHSAQDEYAIWDYMVNRRLKTSGEDNAALHIHTEPPGAVVLVDEVPYGITPLTLVKPLRDESILSKKYKVQVRLEGHEPQTKDASIDVKKKLDRLYIQLEPRKGADPIADKGMKGYRQQLPEPQCELFVREHVLEGEHGTLVLSRDSVIVRSTDKRTLLRVPYGALGKVEKTKKFGIIMQGLTISYRQDGGFEDSVYFAMDQSKGDRDAAYQEIERRLDAKKQEWSGRGPGSASGLTRLPRSGYTAPSLADAALLPGDG